ncbi:MAG TPA: glycosyl hydrolase [Candidatus Limnocylindrales bacterium]|nr:glycosyl hydrolase [Candidatus Limnocylindrales bacterium]
MNCRHVLECASALALIENSPSESARGLAQSKTLTRTSRRQGLLPAVCGLFLRRLITLAGALSVLVDLTARAAAVDSLTENFAHPPASARPWVNWFWVDGNITREGITADLEAMQRVGIGGALLMDVAQEVPPGPVAFNSPEWRALLKHTITEADRLGLQISIHNSPGWCGSGGPWITPELAMRKVLSSRTNLIGPSHFSATLPPLPGDNSSAHDIAILAFPTPVGEGAPVPGFAPKITSSGSEPIGAEKLLDSDSATFVTVPAPAHSKSYLQLEFNEPFRASFLKLVERKPQHFQGRLQVSDNGRTFRDVRQFISSDKGLALPFEAISAKYFRILFTKADPLPQGLEFTELELIPVFRIEVAPAKAGLGRLPPGDSGISSVSNLPPYVAIAPEGITNLTSLVSKAGRLDWDVPKGRWTVVRISDVPTGRGNHPARPGGIGLECDKLSKEAIDAHFATFLAPLISDAGDLAGKSMVATHIDSWENSFQNWTPHFQEEFQRRRGYDPLRYLPAFTGRIVGSLEQSERFLWDVRRTIADLLADNYAGGLAELAHQHGMQLSIEAYGNGPFDDLLYGGRADVPMAEFWLELRDYSDFECRAMPSAAHTYGKPIIAAEAYSSYPTVAKWQNHPFSLKPLGDCAFCEGINRFVFHRYAHQPWLDRQPGMTFGQWGVHYERTATWWEFSKPWHEYVARCQYLLQSGIFVADICYLTTESAYTEAPPRATLRPPVPNGYDYDMACPEVVLKRMSVKDGRLVLPDGLSYRALILPATDKMTPQLLRKIKELVGAGATVVGTPPSRSPSLADYPRCDAEVQTMAGELWGPCDGKRITEHDFGKGKIFWPGPLRQILTDVGVPKDFDQTTTVKGSPVHHIHRTINGTDFYFVADSNPEAQTVDCRFRVKGKQPEFWYPETGRIEKAAIWHEEKEGTVVRLSFNPVGSVFVVFGESSTGIDPFTTITRNGQADQESSVLWSTNGNIEIITERNGRYQAKAVSGKLFQADVDDIPKPLVLEGKWDVKFPPNSGVPERVALDRLISWTEYTNAGVKYFSGTATYTKTFEIPAELFAGHRHLSLDLGKVQVIAHVRLNGQDLGILWKPPFEVDVTEAAKTGRNELEVRVVNLWPNRLIGDEQLPDDCEWRTHGAGYGDPLLKWPDWFLEGKPRPTARITFSSWKHWQKDSPLLESGLIGPVRIMCEQRTIARETATLNR